MMIKPDWNCLFRPDSAKRTKFQIVVWIEARKEGSNRFSGRRHAALQSSKNALFALPHLAHLLTIKARKTAVSPSLTIKNRSKTMERHEKPSKISGHEKTLKPLRFQGFLMISTRDQRLLNCGARRAALRPYFFRSFILGSRVSRPAFFSVPRSSGSVLHRARLMP